MLLNCIYELLLDELTLHLERHVSWANRQKVDLRTSIHPPSNLLLNIDAHLQRLFHGHLPVAAFFGVATTRWSTFSFQLDAVTLWLFRAALPVYLVAVERFNFLVTITAVALALSLLLGVHNVLNAVLFLFLVRFQLLNDFGAVVINAWDFDLVVLDLVVLPFG